MKSYKYTRRVSKIIHDKYLSEELKCKKLEPLIRSYIFTSYRTTYPYSNSHKNYFLNGKMLYKRYGKKDYEFEIIEWGKVSDFVLPSYWKDKFKNYSDRQILHFIIRFFGNKKQTFFQRETTLELYLSLKKFSKSIG